MLNAFADHALVRETVQEASDALNQDLGKLIAEGPAEDLNLTTNTQPVMLTAAYAVYRAWRQAGGPAPAGEREHAPRRPALEHPAPGRAGRDHGLCRAGQRAAW